MLLLTVHVGGPRLKLSIDEVSSAVFAIGRDEGGKAGEGGAGGPRADPWTTQAPPSPPMPGFGWAGRNTSRPTRGHERRDLSEQAIVTALVKIVSSARITLFQIGKEVIEFVLRRLADRRL